MKSPTRTIASLGLAVLVPATVVGQTQVTAVVRQLVRPTLAP